MTNIVIDLESVKIVKKAFENQDYTETAIANITFMSGIASNKYEDFKIIMFLASLLHAFYRVKKEKISVEVTEEFEWTVGIMKVSNKDILFKPFLFEGIMTQNEIEAMRFSIVSQMLEVVSGNVMLSDIWKRFTDRFLTIHGCSVHNTLD